MVFNQSNYPLKKNPQKASLKIRRLVCTSYYGNYRTLTQKTVKIDIIAFTTSDSLNRCRIVAVHSV